MEISLDNIERMELHSERMELHSEKKIKTKVRREEIKAPLEYPGLFSRVIRSANSYWERIDKSFDCKNK